MTEIKFENWGGRKTAVIRNKGKIISWATVKGSKFTSKAEAFKQYKETGSLSKNVSILSRKTTRVGNFDKENIKPVKEKLRIKGKDGVETLKVKYNRAELIGKNTALVKSNNPIKGQKHYQYIAYVYWGDKEKTKTVGYSDIRGNQIQSFIRARYHAEQLNIITYEGIAHFTSDTKGYVLSQDGRNKVEFEINFEVGTYVRTAESS